MTQYAIIDDGIFVEFKHLDFVPNLPGKPYRQFLPVVYETGDPAYEGIENGNWVIRTLPSEPQKPRIVSARQARLALLQAGLLSTVANSISSMSEEIQITWEYATEWNRNDDLIISIGSSLGLSNTDIDNLFITASGF